MKIKTGVPKMSHTNTNTKKLEALQKEMETLLLRQAQESSELLTKHEKIDDIALREKQSEEMKKKHVQEIDELQDQIDLLEVTKSQKSESPRNFITAMVIFALILSIVAIASSFFMRGEQSEINKNNKDEINIVTQATAALSVTVDNNLTATSEAIAKVNLRVDEVDLKVDEVVKITTENTASIESLKKQSKSFITDTSFQKAMKKAETLSGKQRKQAIAKVTKIHQNNMDTQKALNSQFRLNLLDLQYKTAQILFKQGKSFEHIMRLTFAECNDVKRSKGYSKKECKNILKDLIPLLPTYRVVIERKIAYISKLGYKSSLLNEK